MNVIQPLKGFRDFLPEEALRRAWLREQIIKVFEKWGYDPMETPTLEPLELFAGQIDEDEKLFFKFEDNGGRQVALRYDQTVPICRVVGTNQLSMPFRRYQIQTAFRAENTQKGRYREFVQCDADIFGSDSPLADAEVIALSLDIYKSLGFKQAKVLVNDRGLLADLPYAAIVAIDKLAKIGEDGVIKDMIKKDISESDAKKYLQITTQIKPNQTIKTIFEYLKACNFDESWYAFEPTLARSFSYSTGPIWEVIIPEIGGGSVLGGERFDNLVEKISGKKIPGTGFGLGFDRTLEAALQLNLIPQLKTKTKVLVTSSLEVAQKLRQEGINCELYPDQDAKLEKQLKYANKKGIPFVVITDKQEIKLKNMMTRQQKTCTLDECLQEIKRI
jgi:histidyl-tRNA synthetase